MGRRPGMTLEQRNIAIGMLTAGCSVRDVARHFNYSERTIHRLKRRYEQTASVSDRPRSGRPRKTTAREDRYITMTSRRNRFWTSRKIASCLLNATGTRVSAMTVRNRLRSSGLKARRPVVGIPLTLRHRRQRLEWARTHRRWTRQRWNRVLFTDESRFNVQFADGRIRVWRRKDERFNVANVIERDRYGGGSVLIWGGIAHSGTTQLVTVAGNLNAVRYCDEVVRPVVEPFITRGDADVFQQDNARPHTARHTMDTLQQLNIPTLDWPARSPDLSPIEHLWDYLGRKLRQRHIINNVRNMEAALQQEWRQIPIQFVRTLINSMRRRCEAVIRQHGGHTRY